MLRNLREEHYNSGKRQDRQELHTKLITDLDNFVSQKQIWITSGHFTVKYKEWQNVRNLHVAEAKEYKWNITTINLCLLKYNGLAFVVS